MSDNDNCDDNNDQRNDEKYSNDKDNNNYYVSEEIKYINYYESYNVLKNKENNIVYLIISKMFSTFKCKQCDIIFFSNNKLHDYIKNSCLKLFKKIDIMIIKTRKLFIEIIVLQNALQKTFIVIDEKRSQKIFIDVMNAMKSFAKIYVTFIIKTIKRFFTSMCFIVEFTIDSIKNIDIDYDFRE